MEGLSLLLEAARRGIQVHPEGDQLVVQGPEGEKPLADQLLANKAEVLAWLLRHPEYADLDPFTAKILSAFGGTLEGERQDLETAPFDGRTTRPLYRAEEDTGV